VNVAPFITSLSTVMSPPMRRASRREIGSPRPVPRRIESPRGPAFTCSNSSKIRS
jgi:hypothetical protein